MQVKIGIVTPTSADLAYNRQCAPEYARAVQQAGGEAVVLALDAAGEAQRAALESLNGFVLTGSPADVDPGLYGQVRAEATAKADSPREACDRAVLEHAVRTGKPVLAFCFGLQMLNVVQGGTLRQDLAPVPVNHGAGPQVAVAHTVLVGKESLLAGLLSGAEAPGEGAVRRLSVNSSHHQAVAEPGDELAVVARSTEDGVIEALEGRIGESAMVGVQWHPERSVGISAASRALFQWLVLEAEDRRDSVTLEGAG